MLKEFQEMVDTFKMATIGIRDTFSVLKKGFETAGYYANAMKMTLDEYEKRKKYYEGEYKRKFIELDNELKNRNRYFPRSEFITDFEKNCPSEYFYTVIKKGEISYRARIYNINEDTEEKTAKYHGFGKSQSDAPPPKYASVGRINPKGISYLYTASTPETAILEVRPQVGQKVSVATVEVTEEIRLFDFVDTFLLKNMQTDNIQKYIDEYGWRNCFKAGVILNTISDEFSTPSDGDDTNYYAPQYISEFIKNKEHIDGIKFKSSLDCDSYNIVLFDVSEEDRKYKIISSSLLEIEKIEVVSKERIAEKIRRNTTKRIQKVHSRNRVRNARKPLRRR